MPYQAESFFRATIRQSIASDASVPITLKVSKVPGLTTGLITISPNTANEEIVEYNGIDSATLTITVTKRGINPQSILLTTNGVDYNNPTYQKEHTQNDAIRGDVNHIHINQGIGNTTLATDTGVGISKLSVAAVDPGNPIVVGDNDPRLGNKTWGYYWNITSGATLDAIFREIVGFGNDGDNEAAISTTVVTGLGTMTGTITNHSYASSIVLGNGDKCRISFYPAVSTNQIRIIKTGGFARFLGGNNSFNMSSSNTSITFMNSSASDMVITLQAGDGSSGLLKCGLLVEIF